MKNKKTTMSIAKNLQDFIPVSLDFNRLEEITCTKNYSSVLYKKNYRSASNFIEAHLCILDFDGNLALTSAKKIFSEYKAIILTTKSHQKDSKNGKNIKKLDRFRVILVFNEKVTTIDTYVTVMKNITQKFKSDEACTDGARFFYPNPYQQVWYSIGKKMIDVRLYSTKQSKHKNITSCLSMLSNPITVNEGNPLLTDNCNNKLLASQWAEIIEDKTITIHCPNDEHEDTNPSAFISKSTKYENKIYIYCHKCGQLGLYPKTKNTRGKIK